MATNLTYPGVYVREIPSGVHTITGVATSIAAFIGAAARGPEDTPVTLNSYSDFERTFGGLWAPSTLGYAVRDFFINGGGQAIVVRLFNADTSAQAPAAASKVKVGALTFVAASRGTWGANLRASIDQNVSADIAAGYGLAAADLFNLTIRQVDATGATVSTEVFRNLTVKESPRRVDRVLLAQSSLLRWDGTWPPNPLPALAAGDDDITRTAAAQASAAAALATAKAASPQVSATIAAEQTALDTATTASTAAVAAAVGSNGKALTKNDNFTPVGGQANKKGLYALEAADLFNLLCIPPYLASGNVEIALISDAAAYCEQRRAFLLVDPPVEWVDTATAVSKFTDPQTDFIGTRSKNAAIYFPRLLQPDPLRDNQATTFVPCGAVAGIYARTDGDRGVWKAPAGVQASFANVPQLTVSLTDAENGQLNQLGVNCLRSFPVVGKVVWGARTLRGADQLADENKYIPVRRTTLFIEESLRRGLQWALFEPNDDPLWAQIRLNAGAFMQNLFRQGAFQGASPRDAYFVKCDSETTTQNDIDLGVVNVLVGFAPLKPAEFVVIAIQQMAGQITA